MLAGRPPTLREEADRDFLSSKRGCSMLALTHVPSPSLAQCQLTYVAPAPIDYGRAVQQHEAYCQMLRRAGSDVRTLDVNHDLPDSVFIEDTAVVLDEVALLASMGASTRRAEPAGIEPELRRYREVERVEPPATLEGGDVLRIGRTLLVGLSSRTNAAGVEALQRIGRRFGYDVRPVPVGRCLHLKSACAALPDGRLLVNPDWMDSRAFREFDVVRVPIAEPDGANLLLLGTRVCLPLAHPQTAELVRQLGFEAETVDISEFAKAEGCVTCLSLLFTA
jgi:dimethylargininase